jgi:hypothetical protein
MKVILILALFVLFVVAPPVIELAHEATRDNLGPAIAAFGESVDTHRETALRHIAHHRDAVPCHVSDTDTRLDELDELCRETTRGREELVKQWEEILKKCDEIKATYKKLDVADDKLQSLFMPTFLVFFVFVVVAELVSFYRGTS